DQLQQVLLNLFTNAADAMKTAHGAGVLTVRSRTLGDHVMVEVEDDGPGIPAESLGRVFDPFFTTKHVGEGTGLGLSLSIGIVEAHGGTLRARNIPGGGAGFTLTLPPGEGVEVAEPAEVAPAPPARRARILVVEDEMALRTLLTEIFTGLGHQVDEAATAQAAMRRVEQAPYDLVTLDLKLPDIDGKALWHWLRARDPRLASSVIFMTGDTMSSETQEFLQD